MLYSRRTCSVRRGKASAISDGEPESVVALGILIHAYKEEALVRKISKSAGFERRQHERKQGLAGVSPCTLEGR